MTAWKLQRVQYATTTQAKQTNPADFEDVEVVHYSIPALQESGGPVIERASHIESNKLLLKGGEVIVSRLNPHKNCIARVRQHEQPILCSTEFVVFTPLDIEPRYLEYCFRSSFTSQYLTARTESATRSHSRVNPADIIKLKIAQPDLITQGRISDYLDAETAQIDELVAEKERMLALLEEKRAALVSRTVTKGLNPDISLQPSALDWLGDIPTHWKVKRAKQLLAIRDERSETGDEELLTVSHITGVTRRSEKEVFMFKAEDMTGYKLCYPGDLVVNTLWAWMGAMGVASQHGIVSPDYHVYVSKGGLKPAYIEALCRSKPFVAEVIRHSKGVWSSRLRLYPEAFFDMRLPVPPLDEQDAIVTELTRERARTAELEISLYRSIALLKERRSALITAAVTGQLAPEAMSA